MNVEQVGCIALRKLFEGKLGQFGVVLDVGRVFLDAAHDIRHVAGLFEVHSIELFEAKLVPEGIGQEDAAQPKVLHFRAVGLRCRRIDRVSHDDLQGK